MKTIQTTNIPDDQIAQLDEYAETEAGPEMRDLLLSVARCIREGVELAPITGDTILSPNQVADRLVMSRSHLYKLLDHGEIASHRVGRDHRIKLSDVFAFEAQRQHDRRELAQRFATQRNTRDALIDEIVGAL